MDQVDGVDQENLDEVDRAHIQLKGALFEGESAMNFNR